jgi:hypothetical protein
MMTMTLSPKGASHFKKLAASLKRCPDTIQTFTMQTLLDTKLAVHTFSILISYRTDEFPWP